MRISIFTFLLSLSTIAAADPSLTNINKSDFEAVTKEFSGNFVHPSVMGASTLGDILGFEVALVGGQSSSPEIDKIAKRSGGKLPNLYHGGLLLAVSVPFGITGEVVYTPKLSSDDTNFQATSMAAKITLNDTVLAVLPFNLAFRLSQTTSSLDFKQTVAGIEGTVENKNTVTGLQFIVSPNLPMLEPYAGLGYLQAKNELSVSDIPTIFTYTADTSQDTSMSSTQVFLGVNAYLLFFSLGAEYSRAFDTDRYSAKLGFAF